MTMTRTRNRTIEIYVNNKYVCSTNKHSSLQSAIKSVERIIYNGSERQKVRAFYK